MLTETDPRFFARADYLIEKANEQLSTNKPAAVATSFTYAASCFSSWVCMVLSKDAQAMQAMRQEAIDEITAQFRVQLEKNYDSYVANYARFKQGSPTERP